MTPEEEQLLRPPAEYEDRGSPFASLFDSDEGALYEECERAGAFFFLSDEIYMRSEDGAWTTEPCATDVRATSIAVDKIKVITVSRYSSNTDLYHSYNGLEETQSERDPTANNFLHEVVKVFGPMATMARYKQTETGRRFPLRANRCNINMPKGLHEETIVTKTMEAHVRCNTFPRGRLHTRVTRNDENNNSLTIDSYLQSVVNGVTFKANATRKAEFNPTASSSPPSSACFKIVPLSSFGTHQTAVECCRSNRATKGVMEVQVHEHSLNCSAVPGSAILPEIGKKGCLMLADDSLIVSLANNNLKADASKMSRALTNKQVNAFCDALTWEARAHRMTRRQEMAFYRKMRKSVLSKLVVSRDNYAQAGHFCHRQPLCQALFGLADRKMISHRFKNAVTNAFFVRSEPNFPEIHAEAERRNSKKPLSMRRFAAPQNNPVALKKKKKKKKKKKNENSTKNKEMKAKQNAEYRKTKRRQASLCSAGARGESVSECYERGPRIYRRRFRFCAPDSSEI